MAFPRCLPTPRLLVEDRRWRRLSGRRLVRAEVGGHTIKHVGWWRWLLRAGGR